MDTLFTWLMPWLNSVAIAWGNGCCYGIQNVEQSSFTFQWPKLLFVGILQYKFSSSTYWNKNISMQG